MCGRPPAAGHGGVGDQHGADRPDPHPLIDDAVQVRQPAAVRHAHRSLAAHVLVQLLLHAPLDLEWAEQHNRPLRASRHYPAAAWRQ